MAASHPRARIGRRAFAAFALGLAIGSVLCASALAQTPPTHHHDFGGAEKWAGVFDDPARDEWQKPHQVLKALELAPDAIVADIGSGTGYFTVRLAHFVPQGRVYGVDIEPDMVRYLAQRAEKADLHNVTAITGKPDDPLLPAPVDRVLVVDTYHHIGDRSSYFARLRGSLKPGARVAIIDFDARSTIGPPPAERLSPAQVTSEMEAAGYTLVQHHDFLSHQYFLVFEPKKG
jgi:predicted methyltransferase